MPKVLIAGEYGWTQILGPPERLDPTPEELEAARKADRWPLSDVLRAFGWTVDQLNQAIANRNFPRPTGRTVSPVLSALQRSLGEPNYSRKQIFAWYAAELAFAKTLPKTLK